ncbi:MAG: ATP phosphoribosyltransferase, partial [Polyangiaceae bacterium]|nr:ATP phosphoribosyltransferase [Polyangiaceae bacterium]
VCGRPGTPLTSTDGRPLRVATKFPNVASRYFRAKGEPIELIFVQGSVELAPLTGLADVIVDIVETGETLRQNGLEPLEAICDVSSVVVANRASLKLRRAAIDPLLKVLAE